MTNYTRSLLPFIEFFVPHFYQMTPKSVKRGSKMTPSLSILDWTLHMVSLGPNELKMQLLNMNIFANTFHFTTSIFLLHHLLRSILTKSMTTSLPHSERHSAATLHTCITASGSSAFTWKMGAFTTRATSVQYGEDREERGSVVKPI